MAERSILSRRPLLLANELRPEIDPANYLISEKFDGVRALWDGKSLRFRSGRSVHAPAWFVGKLPAQALDGELWLARGRFDALSGIVRKTEPQDGEWRQIKYLIFELPDAPGTFAQRAQRIREVVAKTQWAQLIAVEQFRVADRAVLKRKLDEVVRGGGEGLMLHLADAAYVTGRSDVLLKVKPLQDTEAVVIEHLPGKGKYQGMLGALRVQMPDGKKFHDRHRFHRRRAPASAAGGHDDHVYLSRLQQDRFAAVCELSTSARRILKSRAWVYCRLFDSSSYQSLCSDQPAQLKHAVQRH